MAKRGTWVRASNRSVRAGGFIGDLLRIGVSVGTGGPRVSASVKTGRGRVGISEPVGGSKRRKPIVYAWFR